VLTQLALLALARTEPALATLGLRGDAVRLWARRARCRAAWAQHEAHCHAIVRTAMADLPMKRTALVLGSGLVRDVPIADLSAAFRTIVLVDAVHLPTTRLRLARYGNLRFVTTDISGVARWLTSKAAMREETLASFIEDKNIDLVISANLLSQLPLGPEDWAESHPAASPLPAHELASAIVGWHLADLNSFMSRVCLLTDMRMDEIDANGQKTESLDLLHGHTLPAPDAEWDWDVMPKDKSSNGSRQVHTTRGYTDLAAAALAERART
jgi:hypothetical protein